MLESYFKRDNTFAPTTRRSNGSTLVFSGSQLRYNFGTTEGQNSRVLASRVQHRVSVHSVQLELKSSEED